MKPRLACSSAIFRQVRVSFVSSWTTLPTSASALSSWPRSTIFLAWDRVMLLCVIRRGGWGAVSLLAQRRAAARRGRERVRVLGVDPHLDGVTARADVGRQLQRLAGGQAHLLAHQIDAEHLLGDGVLDLDAGVHLHEVKPLVVVE